MKNHWEILVEYRRAGLCEVAKLGAVAWVSGNKLIHSHGGDITTYGRSSVKPFHIKVFSKELDKSLTWEQKAIGVSSHNAEPCHLELAKSILRPSEQRLVQTPHTLPLQQFGKQIRKPSRWYHTCSGEHSALLRGCQLKGWPRVSYNLPTHPFHKGFIDVIRQTLGPQWSPQFIAKDGCNLPTVSFRLRELATLFSSLAKNKDSDWVWEAMVRNPYLIGGMNRVDSIVMKACMGQVVSKEGADGLLCLGIRHADFPQGLGVAIKTAHGTDHQAVWYIARAILASLDFSVRNPSPLRRQMPVVNPDILPPSLRPRIVGLSMRNEDEPVDDIWNA
ncbi:MAG: asparaginase [Deltaproteobacteria bacterium]|nr:asparaginase [Deltaproteobacteria bacterium]